MYSVWINGKEYQAEEDHSLMDYLRESLGITSVKNGCNQGACGACSVLVDGKSVRACVQKLSKLEGKQVTTLEGLSQRERDVFGYAFSKSGAVQCGFCIPGMIIAAKALINQTPDPTQDDVRKAIRTNICRCTGYVKIIDAIIMAAKMLREDQPIPEEGSEAARVGGTLARVDGLAKALGTAKYVDDITVDGMVYAKAIRPPAPRCKVKRINAAPALAVDGVLAVYTAEDIPGNRYIGHLQKDWPVLVAVGEETRYVGDAVALVVTRTKCQLDKACKLVEIEYEELEPLTDVFEAMKDEAPQIHGQGFMQFGKHFTPKNNCLSYQEVKRGSVDDAFAQAAYISEHDDFYTPMTEHAFMEPECALAIPGEEGSVTVITTGQGIYDEYHEISEMLGYPNGNDKVRIQAAYVGGGFGGKEDMSVQHHAALCAVLCQRPVKVLLSRDESIKIHPKRHAMHMSVKLACDKDGQLLAMRARIISDSGAYASLGGPVLQRACTHAGGPYNYQNMDIEGKAIITNNPPGGAFRGFGVTQSCFAVECCINDLAHQLGMSPWELRYKNAIRPGQSLPNGQIADEGTAFAETLEVCKDFYEEYAGKEGYYVGIASAMKNAGLGVGVPDIGRCNLYITGGKAHIRTSAAAIGQGLQTVLVQMTCETTGLTPDQLVIEHPDTKYTPDSGTTTASRQTVFTGEATRRAAQKLKDALDAGKTMAELEGELFEGEYHFDSDPIGSPKPNPVSHVAYGYATQVVVIDESGKAIVTKQAIDVGKAINPTTLEGQFEGGTAMSFGYGLTEDYPLDKGVPTAKYGTLGLPRSTDMPEIICAIVGKNGPELAFGAKGAGEIASVTFAPAVQDAYFRKDGIFRTRLPLENTFYKKPKVK